MFLKEVVAKKSVVVIARKGELGSEYTDEDVRYELLGVGNGEIVEATGKGCHQRERLKKEGSVLAMNPSTRHYDFCGPPGALLVTLAVPAVAYALFFVCNDANACRPSLDSDALLAAVPSLSDLWDSNAALIYLVWYVFCILAWAILPGDWVDGTTLRDGSKKKYKINGTTPNHPSCRPLTRLSVLNIPARARHCQRHRCQLWPPGIHHPLRELGRSFDRVCTHGHRTSYLLLRLLLPLWCSPRSRW